MFPEYCWMFSNLGNLTAFPHSIRKESTNIIIHKTELNASDSIHNSCTDNIVIPPAQWPPELSVQQNRRVRDNWRQRAGCSSERY